MKISIKESDNAYSINLCIMPECHKDILELDALEEELNKMGVNTSLIVDNITYYGGMGVSLPIDKEGG